MRTKISCIIVLSLVCIFAHQAGAVSLNTGTLYTDIIQPNGSFLQIIGYYNMTEVDTQINYCMANITALESETWTNVSGVNATLMSHLDDTGNPHGVTASQLTITDSDVPDDITITNATNADTVDGSHAGNAANKIPVLDSNGKYVGIPKRDIDGGVEYLVAELASNDIEKIEYTPGINTWFIISKTITIDVTNIDFLKVDFELDSDYAGANSQAKIRYNNIDYASGSTSSLSYVWVSDYADVSALTGSIIFEIWMRSNLGARQIRSRGLDAHANDFEGVDS